MKKTILLTALILCAIFLGSLIGELTVDAEHFSWLARSFEIGVSPFDLDLRVIVLTFGFELHICVAQIFFLLAALLSYPKLAAAITA